MAVDIVARALASKISEIEGAGLTIEEVDSLPDVGKDGTLYVVKETVYIGQGRYSTINKLYIYSDNKFLSFDDGEIIEIFPSFDAESINTTYDELVALRNNSQLVPNTQYRIIDYVTMVSSNGTDEEGVKTESAGHVFDIIVIAISNNELSENALATLHEGDEYFTQDELLKWQLKYTLDNDTSKYKWAYNTNVYAYEEFETEVNFGDGDIGDSYATLKYTGLKKYNGVEYHCWGTEEQIKKVSLHCENDENVFIDIVATEGEDLYGGVIVQLNGIDNSGNIFNAIPRVNNGFITTSSKILVFKGEVGKGVIYYLKDDKDNICHYDFKNILYVTGSDIPGFTYNQWGTNYFFTRDTSLDIEGYYGWRCTRTPSSWNNDYCYTTVQDPSIDMILYSNIDGSELPFGGTIESIELGKGFIKKYTFSYEIIPYIELFVDYSNVLFRRDSSLDTNGYFGWQSEDYSWYRTIYTTNETPSSDTILYANIEGEEVTGEYEFIDIKSEWKIIDFSHSTNLGGCSFNNIGEATDNHDINILGNNVFHAYISMEGSRITENILSKGCKHNKFENDCYCNTFGDNCNHNTFRYKCGYNVFGKYCYYNTFEYSCAYNTFGEDCAYNTFGNNCGNNTFGSNCRSNTFGQGCSGNTFGDGCSDNIFKEWCDDNTFGNNCNSNTFETLITYWEGCVGNTFGNDCSHNTFRYGGDSNTFGNSCYYNTFGNNYRKNTFGNDCSHNTFGNNCSDNTFGDGCFSNTFGYYCDSNTLGNNCIVNTFGDYCNYNTFGSSCDYITFGDENDTINYCKNIQLGNSCKYLFINSLDTESSSSNYLQNVVISPNIQGTSHANRLTITIPDRNLNGYTIGMSTYDLQGQQLTLPTYPTDTENKNYILQLTNGVLSWTLLDDNNNTE